MKAELNLYPFWITMEKSFMKRAARNEVTHVEAYN